MAVQGRLIPGGPEAAGATAEDGLISRLQETGVMTGKDGLMPRLEEVFSTVCSLRFPSCPLWGGDCVCSPEFRREEGRARS